MRIDTSGRVFTRGWFVLVLLLAMGLQVSAKAFTQPLTITLRGASLDKVFYEIKKQSGYLFIYSDKQLENTSAVTINVKNASLEHVLDLCFRNQPVSYKIVENTIVVIPRNNANYQVATQAVAPPIEITGW